MDKDQRKMLWELAEELENTQKTDEQVFYTLRASGILGRDGQFSRQYKYLRAYNKSKCTGKDITLS